VTQATSTPLQTVLGEFKNISPELTKAYLFEKDGETLAANEESITQDKAKKLVASFDEITSQAEVIGGVEALTIQGVSSQLNITSTDSLYLAIVSSRAVDEKMVKALACVIVPTIIKLMDQIPAEATSDTSSNIEEPKVERVEESVQPPQEPTPVEHFSDAPVVSSEKVLPKPPVNQFMVQKIGGLLVASDIVRVDAEVVAKWSDLYGNIEILQVNIETFEGKSVICKFRPMREADGKAKGMIQIPERILQSLRTGEGKLVKVKPVVPASSEGKS
jgi:hypothetical protein